MYNFYITNSLSGKKRSYWEDDADYYADLEDRVWSGRIGKGSKKGKGKGKSGKGFGKKGKGKKGVKKGVKKGGGKKGSRKGKGKGKGKPDVKTPGVSRLRAKLNFVRKNF